MNKKATLALAFMAITTLAFTGCGKKPGAGSESAHESSGGEKTEAAAPAPSAGTGTIKGVVKFTGTAPDMPELNRQSDPFCAETKMKAQYVVVNDNQTLANVGVRVMGAKGGPDGEAMVEIDQKNCMYSPRVIASVDGEEVEIVNSDPTLHNVHTYAGTKTLFNQAQPKGTPPIKKTFNKDDGEIVKFKCDVHPWMTGWLVINDNGFNAVTGTDGSFEIKNVPVGTYTLKSFQEHYGEKDIQVTVEKDKTAEVEFAYDGSEKAAFKYREVTIGFHDGHEHH